MLTLHRIIPDGWSNGVLHKELGELYATYTDGRASGLSELSIQYPDFANWQREWLKGEALKQQLTYWSLALGRRLPMLDLPTDRPRPAVPSYSGQAQVFDLGQGLSNSLNQLSQAAGSTLFMTLLAAFAGLLYRHSGQPVFGIGVPIVNRRWAEIEPLIGLFINTLALRVDASGNPTVMAMLQQVKEAALGAYAHQDLPFEKLVEELETERSLSRTPIFQVMFIFQNIPTEPLSLPGLTAVPERIETGKEKYDLTLAMKESKDGIKGVLSYNTDLFDQTTCTRMTNHLQEIIRGIVANSQANLSDLPLLSPAERQQLSIEWNDTDRDHRLSHGLRELIEAQVERAADAIALVDEEASLSYGELNSRANRLGGYLHHLGVGPEVRVGICLERSLDLVVGLIGILKAGAAFVPLDPTNPEPRLAFMLADSLVSLVITKQRCSARLPRQPAQMLDVDRDWQEIALEHDENAAVEAALDSLLYVVYTSGSTGRPKAVMGTAAATLNRFAWMWEAFPFQADDVCCQKTAVSFVDSIWEIFGPLAAGTRLVIIPDDTLRQPRSLAELLAKEYVSRIILVPSLLNVMLQEIRDIRQSLPCLQCWTSSGEALSADLACEFESRLPDRTLINLYGSSEVAADATCQLITQQTASDSASIGKPIANLRADIVDAHLNPAAIGVAGELCLGGTGVGRGYLTSADLTAERFIPDPYGERRGARIYRTGDLARRRKDGTIDYLGRIDNQVKIRGYRVELGEVEAALAAHEQVSRAIVVARDDAGGAKTLVAYVVANGAGDLDRGGLRRLLKEKLPEYMMPQAIVALPMLPLNPNGKVDRQRLLALEVAGGELAGDYVAPRTENEVLLAGIWANLLGVPHVGANDNFFELGGHSLRAIQMLARLGEAFRIDVPLRNLFDHPTLAEFAQSLDDLVNAPQGEQVQPIRRVARDQQLSFSLTEGARLFDQWLANLRGEPAAPFYLTLAADLEGPLKV